MNSEESSKKPKGLPGKLPFLQKIRGMELGFGKKSGRPMDQMKTKQRLKAGTQTQQVEESEKSELEAFFEKNLPSLAPLAAKLSKKKRAGMAQAKRKRGRRAGCR